MGKEKKKENIIIGTITSLEVINIYAAGVNLSRTYDEFSKPIFISTVFISLISPYLLNTFNTYVFNKVKNKKKTKTKHK